MNLPILLISFLLTGDRMSRPLPRYETDPPWSSRFDQRRTDLADGLPPTSRPGSACWRWGWPGLCWWWRYRTSLALTAAAPLRCSVAWRLGVRALPSYRSRKTDTSDLSSGSVRHWLLSTTIIFCHIPDI